MEKEEELASSGGGEGGALPPKVEEKEDLASSGGGEGGLGLFRWRRRRAWPLQVEE